VPKILFLLSTIYFSFSNTVSISNVVLNGCETWCLKLREEYRLRVFDNRVLGQIFKKGVKELNEIIWRTIGAGGGLL
jgi:hypothetical protein